MGLVGLVMSGYLSVPRAEAALFQASEEDATITKALSEDLFWIGNKEVSLKAPVNGEVFILGSKIIVDQKTDRSIFAAGMTVDLNGGAGYNGYVAGSDVTLSGEYNHDLYVVGDNVTIKDGAVIKGDLRVSGNSIVFAGKVNGDMKFDATSLTFASSSIVGGNVSGNVQKSFNFEGGAIAGDLNYNSKTDASNLDKVKVTGKTERKDLSNEQTDHSFNPMGWLIGLISAIGLCLLVVLLFPRLPKDVEHEIQASWPQAFWKGFLIMIGVPILSLMFIFTGVGWQVGVVMLLFYVILLMLASAVSLIISGRFILSQMKQRELPWWVYAVVGAIIIIALKSLPVVGWTISTVFFIGVNIPVISLVLNWGRKQVC